MSNSTNNLNIIDQFSIGAKKGWNIAINSMLPGVLFAFMLMQIITITGFIDVIEVVFNPVMKLFGLPGVAITPLVISFLTMTGALGAAVNLLLNGQLTAEQLTIIFPSIMLQAAMLQYLGRVLSITEIKTKHYPIMIGIVLLNSLIALIVMSILV